ncbi:(Fe-S)-binding protein [Methanothrix soehngenii]|uniref:(Fe-S)-binding protein n=1 Tax=Methanothrix soehngenii TaxID=2223 RepID=UPI002B54104A|nr:(Fe-S)-binding protein [Methanothrix soehngenii]HOS22427.1 (Fe-S)-binding protein [Methanothrix soehngenii]HPL20795.1 (Fe-S)-binding protein [Methanothrix soehngenii]
MTGSPAEVKLVSNAMANATRRKIMAMLVEKERTNEEIEQAVGGTMLDYHLQMLKQAGLADMREDRVVITDFGTNFMETKSEKPAEAKKSLAGTRPLQVVDLRQLLPCIADSSKFRIIARFEPPLEGALKLLGPLFPRARYSDRIGALIIQKGNTLITIYSTGNVTMTMIKSEDEAREVLEDLKKTINEAISKGVTPVPREKVKVDHAEIYQYLPRTDCQICGEQSCYAFAIKLVGRETEIDKCTPLIEPKYATNLEHIRTLLEYL